MPTNGPMKWNGWKKARVVGLVRSLPLEMLELFGAVVCSL